MTREFLFGFSCSKYKIWIGVRYKIIKQKIGRFKPKTRSNSTVASSTLIQLKNYWTCVYIIYYFNMRNMYFNL